MNIEQGIEPVYLTVPWPIKGRMSVGRVAIQVFWLPAGFKGVKRGFRLCYRQNIAENQPASSQEPPAQPLQQGPQMAGHRNFDNTARPPGKQGDWFLAGVVDIAEDIDFIHITEAVGIIAGGNGLSPFCFSIRSTASRLLRLTVRDLVRD